MRVRGVGPTPSRLVLVGSGPGWQEDREGVAFVGRTGDELARFLNGVDLPAKQDVFLTNLYREYGGKNYHYTSEDLRRDEPDLIAELRRAQPATIVPLGRDAARWFMGDIDLEAVQGIPWFINAERWNGPERVVCFPITHPASAFHNPEMASYVVSGFTQLAEYLSGKTAPRVLFADPYPETTYEEITSLFQLETSLCRLKTGQALAIDTEGWPGNPWSMQYSSEQGTAFLISAKCPELLRLFSLSLRRIRPRLIYHSALHDLGMQRALALELDGLTFDDTMVMAYLLQIEPQGLKPLAVRHCNMQMQSYDDILGDASERIALDHLTWLWDIEQFEYEETQHEEFNRQITAGRRIKALPKLPKTPLHKAVQRCLQSKTPRRLWYDQVEDIQVAGYHRLGLMPEATLDLVPTATAVYYGCRDADGTVRLLPELRRRIESMGLQRVYELEIHTYPLIDRMSKTGIRPDLDHFKALSERLSAEISNLRTRLCEHTGREDFNANSGDQVADYLFGALSLEEGRRTESGRGSTNDKILEGLEHEHPEYPAISDIRAYREIYKLKNTFCDRLPDFTDRWPFDGRVHATFRTTRVVTGRLAASDPNLLAMPKHGKFAKDFRRGWVPEPDHVFGSWDESQIELRIAAHLSQDPVMLAIYRGERRNPDGSMIDLHASLAERIFGVKPQLQDESKHRLPSKAINFGFWMGQTAKGLQVELAKNGLRVDEDDAQKWLDGAHGLYKGARPYMDARIAEATQRGYVRCLSGRIRYIGGIGSKNDRVREEAERFAFSTPIQEGAQTVMKTNEIVLWNDILVPLWRQGYWIEPLLQIHDDIVLEIENEELARLVNPMMVECMTQSYKGLSVPLQTSASWGVNWADMNKF